MTKIGILRVNPELRDEAKKIAKKNHITLTKFTENALKELINNMGYNYDSLMELIKKIPSLALYQDILKDELKGAPRDLIKNIMRILEKDNTRFHRIILKQDEENKLQEIIAKKINGLVIIAKVCSEEDVDKTSEKILKFIENIATAKENLVIAMKRDFSLKENSELLIFVSYAKEDEKSET